MWETVLRSEVVRSGMEGGDEEKGQTRLGVSWLDQHVIRC